MGDDREPLAERTLAGLHEHLIGRLPSVPLSAAILDVGCGTGAWLERLSRAGFKRLWGVDLDLTGLAFRGATTAVADLDAEQVPFGDQRFDVITAIEVVEHLENPGRLYRLFDRLLSETGFALITTPNIHSLNARLRHFVTGRVGQFDEKGEPTHVMPVLLDGVLRILPRHGLEIAAQWGYPDHGSIIYRRPLQLAARVLSLALPDTVPGDTLCLLIRRSSRRIDLKSIPA